MNKALLQMHTAVLLWGFTGVLGKAISLSAPILVWYRMLFTAVIIGIIILWRKQWVPVAKRDMLKVITIGLLFAVHWVAFYASIKLANASIAMICLATSSIFTAIVDPLVNKKQFNTKEIGLSLIAVLGVCCIGIFQPDSGVNNTGQGMVNFEWGLVLGIVASVLSAIFTILNKPLTQKYPPRRLVFLEMAAGLGMLTLAAPIYIYYNPELPLIPVGYDWLWIFILSYCCTVWGQSLAMNALKKLSPFTVNLSVNLEPVYGIILAFVIYKENTQLGWGFYAGMVLIFLSMFIQVLWVLKQKRSLPIIND
jgi:drug/metabolite transporter (DMT)-like permease